eukprot:9154128-Pyramimonas_sp.AAC.1
MGEHHCQHLRLHQCLREHETQPPAGISLRRVGRGGATIRNQGAALHVREHGMCRRLATCTDCAGRADGVASRPR